MIQYAPPPAKVAKNIANFKIVCYLKLVAELAIPLPSFLRLTT